MLNKCIFMGRLTKDPEIRYIQGTEPVAVARFNLAVDQDFKKNGEKAADFFEIEAWRQRAEFCEKYLRKGQLICVEGSMHQYSWEDKMSGNKRYGYKLSVNNIYFAEGKKQGGDQDGNQVGQAQHGNAGGAYAASTPPDFDPLAGGSDSDGDFDPFAGDDDMSFRVSEDSEDMVF